MTSDLVEAFAATAGDPLLWLSVVVLVFLLPRARAVRAAAIAAATGMALLERDPLVPAWQWAAEIAVAAAGGLLVGQAVLGLVVPAILLALAAAIRCLAFTRNALAAIRGAPPRRDDREAGDG